MKQIPFLLLALILGACIPAPASEAPPTAPTPYRITPDENPFAPKLEDAGRQVAAASITSVILSERYDFSPPRAAINITGYMPGVCGELRIEISPPDGEYRLFIEAYSLSNPDVQCDNVFQQFEADILLGRYSPGRYSVWVNDSLVGDFVSY